MRSLKHEGNAGARIRSAIWDFLHTNKWTDKDDFSLLFSEKIYEKLLRAPRFSIEELLEILDGIGTTFFMVNRISKRQFAELLISDCGRKLAAIVAETPTVISLDKPKILPKVAKILFLAANPNDTVRLRLDEEIREIERQILLAQMKERLVLVNKGAVRTGDLQFYLNQERPTIVHFSGHGTSEGRIILEDNTGNAKTVSPEALTRVFKVLKDDIRCVVLNACFSAEQASAINKHIDCVIGMSSSISDEAAIVFAAAFYLAIASERSVGNAFDQGINEIMLLGIPEENIPRLLSRDNIDPSKIFLLPSISTETEEIGARKSKECIDNAEGITAHLFFPAGTPEKNKNSGYHRRHFHHRLVVNHKMHPPEAYYITPNSDGWRFIEKCPELWVSEIVTSRRYRIDDPKFTQKWCDEKGYRLIPKIAENKDLLRSD